MPAVDCPLSFRPGRSFVEGPPSGLGTPPNAVGDHRGPAGLKSFPPPLDRCRQRAECCTSSRPPGRPYHARGRYRPVAGNGRDTVHYSGEQPRTPDRARRALAPANRHRRLDRRDRRPARPDSPLRPRVVRQLPSGFPRAVPGRRADRVAEFVAAIAGEAGQAAGWRTWFRRSGPPARRALYLDGGFGVGKTHLLAAAYRAAPAPKAYLSFAELTYLVGHLGMSTCLAALRPLRFLAVDEFELDDVANTRLAATLLRGLFEAPAGGRDRSHVQVVTTSNTLPHQLGAGRFAADDFKHEIGQIASVLRSRPDRRRGLPAPASLDGHSGPRGHDAGPASARFAGYRPITGAKVFTSFDGLMARLAELHPIRYVRLLDPVEALFVDGLAPVEDQSAALRFVHFVDKLYDQQIRLAVSTTCDLEDVFLATYRDKGYAKKYQRCLSRLHELLEESAGALER